MGSRLEKKSTEVRKRIENHHFEDEGGEEYEGSKFGGFSDYFRRKKIKLQNLDVELRSQSTECPAIFRGVVAHVNGYTQPSLRDLHTLIVTYGGGFMQYLDGKTTVTHVIASGLTPKKKVEFAKYRMVRPAWVVDSVKAGRLLPWDAYRVVDEGVSQRVLGFDAGRITSQINSQPQGYRAESNSSWYTTHVQSIAKELNSGNSGRPMRMEEDPEVARDDPEQTYSDGIDDESLLLADVDDAPNVDEQVPSEGLPNHDTSVEDHVGFESGMRGRPTRHGNHDEIFDEHSICLPESGDQVTRPTLTEFVADEPDSASSRSPEKRKLTAEEHNAILLLNPHLAKSSTANPDFLNQYYRESRLHHLSTWKADLKNQLQSRAAESSASQKARQKRILGARRYIIHIDFDSFFAAVSLRKHPELAEKPVVIAHGSGPGSEIASCNYPARKFGVKNGMWMKSALQLCPNIHVLPYDFKAYEEASRNFYDSILGVDGIVQSISIDEALVDISQQCIQAGGSDGKTIQEACIHREQAKANEIAESLRATVRKKTGCEVSVGIGNNILLAKVALRKAKPAGQYFVTPEEALNVVGELTVTDLPGVAYSIGHKLEEIGVKYVKDIRELTRDRMTTVLGPKTGEKLWEYSRAIDKAEVGDQVVRKSVSAEINWGIRFVTQQQAEEFVQCLCDELQKRLREQGVKGKQLTMKIMRKAADAGMDPPKSLGHGKCDTFNKSIVLGVSTTDKDVLGKEAISILRSYGFPPGELRGLGVQMQKLEPLKQTSAAATTGQDGSQRRLQFKKPDALFTPRKAQPEFLGDFPSASKTSMDFSKPDTYADPIEETPTPDKSEKWSSMVGPLKNQASPAHTDMRTKPLNIMGTQFLLPTQIDPSVLAELPSDIRSKLATRQRQISNVITRDKSPQPSPGPKPNSRSNSPFGFYMENDIPPQSQIDPSVLQELPEDVRNELLSHYQQTSKKGGGSNQQLLPQSPRKAHALPSKKLVITPTKKQKTSNLFGRGKSKAMSTTGSTLTQSNFVSIPKVSKDQNQPNLPISDEISQSFLEELPEDIRLELLAEQKLNRMKVKSGLNVNMSRKKLRKADHDITSGQLKLALPTHPEKPTFTSKKLSTLQELRDAMSAWVEEFAGEGEDGPFEEDVTALVTYLTKVVTIELDMDKAVKIVDWVSYLIEDRKVTDIPILTAWENAIGRLKDGVQHAVQERGLPPVEFC